MIFSELYSVYYNTVAEIIKLSFNPEVTEKELQNCVIKKAFSESVLTILPALKSQRWHLLNDDLSPVLYNEPTMPLTTLEKRWLKSISDDPRVKLFGVEFPELGDVEPLFTKDDYKIYDQYCDGDPFEDENYIKNFRFILSAIKEKKFIRITILNRCGGKSSFNLYPKGFEYSLKDDKIRVIAGGCKYKQFNLAKVISCTYCNKNLSDTDAVPADIKRSLTLEITDERNALERVMLHFAHFEKQAQKTDHGKYILHINYLASDETEIVIRVLSFGPLVKVLAPNSFINLIKERLISQKAVDSFEFAAFFP